MKTQSTQTQGTEAELAASNLQSPTKEIQSAAVDANDCRSSGFEDGLNSGFNLNTWTNCDADQWML
jgi:hypothetical protein